MLVHNRKHYFKGYHDTWLFSTSSGNGRSLQICFHYLSTSTNSGKDFIKTVHAGHQERYNTL